MVVNTITEAKAHLPYHRGKIRIHEDFDTLPEDIALWWLADDPALSDALRDHIGDTTNLVFVSAATVWEVSIKASLGKVEVDESWTDALGMDGMQPLPIRWNHAA